MSESGRRTPSLEEFRAAVGREFAFVREERGFALEWDARHPLVATFRRANLAVRVEGVNYGSGTMVTLLADDSALPSLFAPLQVSAPTDCPQLDELREHALRLRHELADFFAGDLSRFEAKRQELEQHERARRAAREADPKGLFFSRADALWKNKKSRDLVAHLRASPYPLSPIWLDRLAAAEREA